MAENECFLSGLDIPQGRYSIEHVTPRSKIPPSLANTIYNIKPSIKVFNAIKSDRFYCQWIDMKYDLCLRAYKKWNLRNPDKKLLQMALKYGMPDREPCEYCVCAVNPEYCINIMRLQNHIKTY